MSAHVCVYVDVMVCVVVMYVLTRLVDNVVAIVIIVVGAPPAEPQRPLERGVVPVVIAGFGVAAEMSRTETQSPGSLRSTSASDVAVVLPEAERREWLEWHDELIFERRVFLEETTAPPRFPRNGDWQSH